MVGWWCVVIPVLGIVNFRRRVAGGPAWHGGLTVCDPEEWRVCLWCSALPLLC